MRAIYNESRSLLSIFKMIKKYFGEKRNKSYVTISIHQHVKSARAAGFAPSVPTYFTTSSVRRAFLIN